MIHKQLFFSLFFICSFNCMFSQNMKKANVKNYDSYYESLAQNKVNSKISGNPSNQKYNSISTKNDINNVSNSDKKFKIDTLFYESFSNKSFDNIWLSDSGTDNMIGYIDPITKEKYLKITCNRPNGNSFLEIDLTNKVRGKKIKLNGLIKTENIKRGSQSWEIGQLCIKFLVENKTFYECVQNLEGTSDWDSYYAHEDGSDNRDNTEEGSYVFFVPDNAKKVTLYLGLQNCTGTIYFRDITVVEIK